MQYATRPHWYIGMPGMHNIGSGTYMVVDTHGYRMDVVEACSCRVHDKQEAYYYLRTAGHRVSHTAGIV